MPGSAQLPLIRLCGLEVLLLPGGDHVLEVGPEALPGPTQLGLVFPHADVVVPNVPLEVTEGLQQDVEGWSKPHH